jgi:hypothetical protein
MLAGLGVGGNGNCSALGVGTVVGAFAEDNQAVESGIVRYEWAGGCHVGEVDVGVAIKLESDFTAARAGDYDVSTVEAAEPIDEEGTVVDPEQPVE